MGKQRGKLRSWRTRGSTEEGSGGCQSTLPVFICTFSIFKPLRCTAQWRPDWKRKGFPQQIFRDLFASLPTTFTHNKCDPAAIPAHSWAEWGLFPPEPCCSPGRAAQEAGAEPILPIPPCSFPKLCLWHIPRIGRSWWINGRGAGASWARCEGQPGNH